MNRIKVDGRGLSCPQPVILTMEAIKKDADEYEILVDNKTALENVSRFLKKAGKEFTYKTNDDDYIIEVK